MICVLYFQATVMNWIAKGYVPGADMNYIPDSAREPYTAARAKNGIARIKSILKACCDGKGVVPALFGMTQMQFDACMQYPEQEGYIYKYVEDGCTYYDGTPKGQDSLQKFKKSDWIALFTTGASIFPAIVQLVSLIVR